jgi:hypothetical protein
MSGLNIHNMLITKVQQSLATHSKMPIYGLLDKDIIVYQNLISLFQTTKINNIQALRPMQKCAQEDISENKCVTFNLFMEFFQKIFKPS